MTILDKACWERGCPCHEDGEEGVEVVKREWVGLTDEEIFEIWMKSRSETEDRFDFVNRVIAKLKEKNT